MARLLLVEDEIAHVEVITRAFRGSAPHWLVESVGTLAEYRQASVARPPDLALMDLNLPDGLALEALVPPPNCSSFPIAVMTSHGDERIAVEIMKSGAVDYILKSAEAFRDIVHTAERILREWQLRVEHQQAQDALERSEENLRRAQDIAHMGHWRYDAVSLQSIFSASAAAILGVSAETWICYEGFFLASYPGDHMIPESEWCRAISAGTYRAEQRLESGAGFRWIQICAEPVFDADERLSGAVGTVQDVTERKLLELQLLQSQKMESFGQLAGGMAHDFNNMLTVIMGYADLALSHSASVDSMRPYVEEIVSATQRSAGLVRQLLAFARRQPVSPQVVDVNTATETLVRMFEHVGGGTIPMDWRPQDGLWAVQVDSSQLDQVLSNLLVNARDAVEDGGRIVVETQNRKIDEAAVRLHPDALPGEYVVISVSDTGMGMSPLTLSRIFEPFFSTKGKDRGTGLGLSTVYGIVRQHGGYVLVESVLGEGTRVDVYLPRYTPSKQRGIGTKNLSGAEIGDVADAPSNSAGCLV